MPRVLPHPEDRETWTNKIINWPVPMSADDRVDVEEIHQQFVRTSRTSILKGLLRLGLQVAKRDPALLPAEILRP